MKNLQVEHFRISEIMEKYSTLKQPKIGATSLFHLPALPTLSIVV